MNKFICKGPVIGTISQADIDKSVADVDAGELDKAIPQDALGHKKRGVIKKITSSKGGVSLNENGDPEIVSPEAQKTIVPCGHDLTPLIEAVPFDGLEYEVVCPSCGNVVAVKRVADQ